MPQPSLIQAIGYSSSSCGYCSPPGQRSSKKESSSYGFWAHQLSVEFYDWLMNRGWRRSGKYVYHPDMARTCCPQYTIRLEASRFVATKKQKRALNNFNRLLLTGAETWGSGRPHALVSPAKPGKGKYNVPFDLHRRVHLAEERVAMSTPSPYPLLSPASVPSTNEPIHRLKISFHPSSPPHPAVHPIYQRYQAAIHQDPKADAPDSFASFSRFLCDSPLLKDEIFFPNAPTGKAARQAWLDDKGLPGTWGSWHQIYEADGAVVAFGVLDIVPTGVSSVYFCYDPASPLSADVKWGKISTLREIALVQDMHAAGLAEFKYEYLGFYVHSCQKRPFKMRYKGEYKPSELLDPATNIFHPIEPLVPHLDQHQRGAFSFVDPQPPAMLWSMLSDVSMDDAEEHWVDEEDSDDEGEGDGAFPRPPPPSFLDPTEVSPVALGEVKVMIPGRGYTTLSASPMRKIPAIRQALSELVAALHGPGSHGPRVLADDSSTVGIVVVAL